MVNAYNIDAISIGNGTASRETEFFIKKIAFETRATGEQGEAKPVQVFIVSEGSFGVFGFQNCP